MNRTTTHFQNARNALLVSIQNAFPGKQPPAPIINKENISLNMVTNEKKLGRKVLEEIDSVWQEIYDPYQKYCPRLTWLKKISSQTRKQKRHIVKEVEQQFAVSYSRKRSFESTPAKRSLTEWTKHWMGYRKCYGWTQEIPSKKSQAIRKSIGQHSPEK